MDNAPKLNSTEQELNALANELKKEHRLGRRHFGLEFDGIWEKALREGRATVETIGPDEPLMSTRKHALSRLGCELIMNSRGQRISLSPESIESLALLKALVSLQK